MTGCRLHGTRPAIGAASVRNVYPICYGDASRQSAICLHKSDIRIFCHEDPDIAFILAFFCKNNLWRFPGSQVSAIRYCLSRKFCIREKSEKGTSRLTGFKQITADPDIKARAHQELFPMPLARPRSNSDPGSLECIRSISTINNNFISVYT